LDGGDDVRRARAEAKPRCIMQIGLGVDVPSERWHVEQVEFDYIRRPVSCSRSRAELWCESSPRPGDEQRRARSGGV